jgi:hypothetical protein
MVRIRDVGSAMALICSRHVTDAATVVADARDVFRPQRNALHRTAAGFFGAPVPTRYSARFRFLLGSRWVPSHGVAL